MSLEIRRGTHGPCKCPGPYGPDEEIQCSHWWECDWGVIEHSDPRPDRGEVGHLMLATTGYVDLLLNNGPIPFLMKGGRVDSASVDGDRLFVHIEWGGKRWTWELFEAHICVGKGWPHNLLIGRWPD
ncbi:hypothetical protein DOROTHY_79 [Mycobacterium phage Dorothy]|uniref:Uncharacterized protein n=6 Tax=Cheoctovirus TaxID=1623281 RepID=A0A249XQA2_9CAUD|nr:hypothetical protein N856_gp077 [Mycobacterium phage Daenerys]YP_009125357.1 hypothetical protein VC69_gp076 [Mycobacterium phage Inventum]YP_009592054.1 hypothetical protein FDG65_gp079 [Mycobacterium phage Dorothy]YP_009958315.1 hypothetical protein I5H49_gp078 [Mycobacterium phage JoeyJr]YP_009960761.1 hypothetical protein I5H73_gp075 [Mycobacterium phage OldBen]YP_009961906.1 hypothetical protein I5H84_gp078 [Mycobacterium phage RitaG]YP_010092541.1 hypothetical protein KNT74_gp71 [Myc